MSPAPSPPENFAASFDFRKEALEAFADWYRTNRPDAIVTLHLEVGEWLRSLRVEVPRELGLVHLDRQESMTDWAGMDQNNYCIGSSATDMIVGALHRNEQGVPRFARSITLQSKWIAGATVAPQGSKTLGTQRGISPRAKQESVRAESTKK